MNVISLDGIDGLLSTLRNKLQSGAEKVENAGMKAGGAIMATAMQSHVNVSDSEYEHLKDDIKVSNVTRKDGMKYVLIGPTRKTGWRGHFLEYGTTKMSARPFVYPGFRESADEALKAMADSFREGLRQ